MLAQSTKSYFRKPFIDKLYPLHKTNFLLLLFNYILCLQLFYSNLFPSQINIISPPKKKQPECRLKRKLMLVSIGTWLVKQLKFQWKQINRTENIATGTNFSRLEKYCHYMLLIFG